MALEGLAAVGAVEAELVSGAPVGGAIVIALSAELEKLAAQLAELHFEGIDLWLIRSELVRNNLTVLDDEVKPSLFMQLAEMIFPVGNLGFDMQPLLTDSLAVH